MNEKMPIEHYRSLGSLEDHYWWHQTRYQIVWRLLTPAHAFLFSEWDRTLRHYRRYSRAGVSRLLDGAGFRVLETSHFFSFALPMAVARRYVGAYDGSAACEFPAVPALLNRALLQAGRIEGALLRRVRVPFGTSLYVVAQCREDR